ncbi:putative glycoside hydrolase [Pseudoduganella aquatica]|uniref:GTP-binding protein n=1 Tax=Pseudoduganella aquatica TaxID=2660641 RepID=A0A7X4HCF1_9BURK|nr:putative glycoside hydrolase [Pseudoduganella aquatica]MYN08613.1 GTP-binding protein [Pseudoduganella aquatica]
MISRLALLTLLCAPVAAQPLDGRVLDAVSRQPIAGAVVAAGGKAATTGPDGSYHLNATGTVLQARAIGYSRVSARLPQAAAAPLLLLPLRPKALYLSVYGIGDAGLRQSALRLLADTELNALVIDLKGDSGIVPYPSKVALAAQCGARSVTTVQDMPALVAGLKQAGVYLIARIVTFKDDRLAAAHPEWRVQREDGTPFRDREHMAWIDPFRREAWPYFLDLAEEAAAMGFDEIQFDYVRFPDSGGLRFALPNSTANRVAAIVEFLASARARLLPHNVFLAADLFGYTAWNDDDTQIGQDLPAIAAVVDYVSPMLYPSGFQFGIPGYRNPVQHPAEIVHRTLRRALARTGGNPLRFRPWLQAFRDYAFDRRAFDEDEVRAQIDAAESAGSAGWMLWNPRNDYTAAGLRRR